MKIKNNIIFQYTISTFLIIFISTIFLSTLLVNWSADQQILHHINLYPEIVHQKIKANSEVYTFFESFRPDNISDELNLFFKEFKSFGKIFRIKVWGKDAVVIWSDNKDIIGKTFPENPHYQASIKGGNVYSIDKPSKKENISEADESSYVLEIYTPVFKDGEVIGVVELYEAADQLFDEIDKNSYFIWFLMATTGLVIYLTLFTVFYQAYRRQKKSQDNLMKTQDVTIRALAILAETRDNETGAHIIRTQLYLKELAEYLKNSQRFKDFLSKENIGLLFKSAPLHDIGKVGIPDNILLKPGKLTKEEFNEMKKHAVYGKEALKKAQEKLGSDSFLKIAEEITYSHHEKWDGSGYPLGLKGDDIPISGRLMALVDVYDALISKRVYKPAFSHEKAVEIIKESKGTHFDPEVVEAFQKLEKIFKKIAEENKEV